MKAACQTRKHPTALPLRCSHLVSLALAQNVSELVQRRSEELGLGPQVRRQVAVGVTDSDEGSLESVLQGLGGARGRGVAVLNTSELEETLDSGRGDNARTAGSGDESDGDGTALAGLLGRERVRGTEVGSPVAATDGDDGELGDDDGGTDGGRDFLGGLDAETDVALRVTNDDDGLEAGALAGTGLLLDGLDLHGEDTLASKFSSLVACANPMAAVSTDLHNLILELRQESVDDLVLLDREGVEVDLLHGLYLASLDETAQLGDRLPLLLFALAGTAASATASASSVTTAAVCNKKCVST